MNFETIVIMAIVALLGGWLAGFVMKGGGYGLVGDITLGVVGGIAGGSVLWMQGIATARSPYAMVGAAFVGAFILVVIQRKFWKMEMAATM
jgi:uncharacterized membrane protein YeaQ/YmgE (transglycosylase-associated protein family)